MQPIYEKHQIVDEEEIYNYESYLRSIQTIPMYSSLDYYSYQKLYPDQILEHSKWTNFTEPLLSDEDYQKLRKRNNALTEFKSDLEVFDNFGNFNYKKLDSYKLEKTIMQYQEAKDAKLQQNNLNRGGDNFQVFWRDDGNLNFSH